MANDCNCNDTQEIYQGNGVKLGYSFSFPYIEPDDIFVDRWDEETYEWVAVPTSDWKLQTVSIVQFNSPPTYKFKIYRCTDVNPPAAVFHPGHAIKARDLNDNFEQLAFAVEDNCSRIKSNTEDHKDFWRKDGETLYSGDEWNPSDDTIASTAAIEDRMSEVLEGFEVVTGVEQDQKQWNESKTNDETFATTSALVKRHDNLVSDSGANSSSYIQPGKFWINTSEQTLFYRKESGRQWIQINTKGSQGEPGEPGQDSTVPGPPGDAATITVGNTTTGQPGTDADVVNVGTDSAAVLEFTIPQGEKGDDGGEILTFTAPLVKTGTVVSLDLLTIPNAP